MRPHSLPFRCRFALSLALTAAGALPAQERFGGTDTDDENVKRDGSLVIWDGA
jgi:hypothetical protein